MDGTAAVYAGWHSSTTTEDKHSGNITGTQFMKLNSRDFIHAGCHDIDRPSLNSFGLVTRQKGLHSYDGNPSLLPAPVESMVRNGGAPSLQRAGSQARLIPLGFLWVRWLWR